MSTRQHPEQEGRELIEFAATIGWRAVPPSGGGYFKLLCGCSHKHMTWLHLTPSRNYWKRKKAYLERTCRGPDGAEGEKVP